MFTKVFLKQVEAAVFQPFFMDGIRAIHDDEVAAGKFDTAQGEYRDAMAAFKQDASSQMLQLLASYETICEQIRELSAHHGFAAGVYAGFRQIFTAHREPDGGYQKYVTNEIMMLPNMQRYTELYQAVTRRNAIYEQLAGGRPETCDSPMVWIACYWDELAHSAAANAFYCGYRAACMLADRFGLTETDAFARACKLLILEHTFQYIESLSEKERHSEHAYTII